MKEISARLLRVDEARRRGIEPYELARQTRQGRLRRLRRGVYVAEADWEELSPGLRCELAMQVAVEAYGFRLPLYGLSSAFMFGLPLRNELTPDSAVHLFNPSAQGGRSTRGITHHRPDGRDRGVVFVRGLPCSDVVNTALDVAKGENHEWAVAILDRLLNLKPLPGEKDGGEWDSAMRGAMPRPQSAPQRDRAPSPVRRDRSLVQEAIDTITNGAVRRRLSAALSFADAGGFLPGESLSRVLIHRFGFPQPRLQVPFRDRAGLIGYTDFYWKEHRTVGEFDGLAKYSKDEYLNGRTPSAVVTAEKLREDRLRRLGLTVVRWTWADIEEPDRLLSRLRGAGLPRVPSTPWDLPAPERP